MKSDFLYNPNKNLINHNVVIIEIDTIITIDAFDILSYILCLSDPINNDPINNAMINHIPPSIKVIAYSFKTTAIIFSMTDSSRLFNTNIIFITPAVSTFVCSQGYLLTLYNLIDCHLQIL